MQLYPETIGYVGFLFVSLALGWLVWRSGFKITATLPMAFLGIVAWWILATLEPDLWATSLIIAMTPVAMMILGYAISDMLFDILIQRKVDGAAAAAPTDSGAGGHRRGPMNFSARQVKQAPPAQGWGNRG